MFPKDQPNLDKVHPGMSLRIRLLCKTLKNVLFVPLEAVYFKESKPYVRIGRGRMDFTEQLVELGEKNHDEVVITKGLRQGDPILLFEPKADKEP